jgi:hypothetical protein
MSTIVENEPQKAPVKFIAAEDEYRTMHCKLKVKCLIDEFGTNAPPTSTIM